MAKKYMLKIDISIPEQRDYGDGVKALAFRVEERIPDGVNPGEYLKQRLSEEIKRHVPLAKFEHVDGDKDGGLDL